MISEKEKQSILNFLEENKQVRLSTLCKYLEISTRTIQRWKKDGLKDNRKGAEKSVPKKLSKEEELAIYSLCCSNEYKEMNPFTLTLAKDGYYYPLPYSGETVRQRSKGYFLPAVIGKRNREKFVATSLVIEGCFVTRLDYSCILALFLLLFKNDIESFDLYADRIFEKKIYKNIKVKNFELRAENGEAFKLRVDPLCQDRCRVKG